MTMTMDAQVLYSLGCEVRTCPFSEAQEGFGLPLSWCDTIAEARERRCGEEESRRRREVYQVRVVLAGSPPADTLRAGDILLAVEEVPLVDYVEQAEAKADELGREGKQVSVTVLRDREVLDVLVQPAALRVTGTRDLITFGGVQMQHTHDAARFHGYAPPAVMERNKPGVYVSSIRSGSPAQKSGLNPVHWITHLDDVPVSDLEDVKAIVVRYRHRDVVRVRTLDYQGLPGIRTLELDFDHWPTTQHAYDPETRTWKVSLISSGDS